MEVVNIGIIIRNDRNDTFPVALTPNMVGIIQNLLTQIPKMESKLVDPSGRKLTAQESIPIIPRRVDFDWDAAYEPMTSKEETEKMKELVKDYEGKGDVKPEPHALPQPEQAPDMDRKILQLNPPEDKLNPLRLKAEGTGTSNAGMSDAEVDNAMKEADAKLVDDARYPDPLKEVEAKDCMVEVEALGIGADAPNPGGQ